MAERKFTTKTGRQREETTTEGLLRGGPMVAGVEVSVIISESHNYTAQSTKLAMESGTIVSDHIILQPVAVDIVFEVVNTAEGKAIAKDVLETFYNVMAQRELLELITEHRVYENMALVNVSALHAAPFKGRLQLSATLEEMPQVVIESVGREPSRLAAGSTSKTASAEVKDGTQNTQEVDNRSGLKKIKDGANANAS